MKNISLSELGYILKESCAYFRMMHGINVNDLTAYSIEQLLKRLEDMILKVKRLDVQYKKSGELMPCPHCGARAVVVMGSKSFSKRHKKKVQFARIICVENNPFNYFNGKRRCLMKTVAAEISEVIEHWNTRV